MAQPRYNNPKAASRKRRVYLAFCDGGVANAKLVGRECGILPSTLSGWFSEFRRREPSLRLPARNRPKKGPNANTELRIMELAYRLGGLAMARDVGVTIKLRPETIDYYAKVIEADSKLNETPSSATGRSDDGAVIDRSVLRDR